jgi:hypothetical protein
MEEVPVAKADIAALLAVGAALFIAIGDVMHQRAAHEVTDEPVGNIGLFTRLLRDGQWWLGSVVAAVGFALQAAALGLGSVLLVQALLVTSLLFALPISAWTGVILVMGPVLVLCIIGARVWSGPARAVLLALVSGSLWGLFAVLTKGVVDRLDDGIWQLVRTPEMYAWALVAIAGTAWQQSSFRAGSMTASLPTMTVAEPVVGSSLGILVLGETLRPGDAGWFTLIVAVAVMVVATAALARGAAITTPTPVQPSGGLERWGHLPPEGLGDDPGINTGR